MVGESQEPVGSTVGGGQSGSNKMPTLEEYGTNLTTQAEEGKLDPVVGRKKEIERVTQVGAAAGVGTGMSRLAGWLAWSWGRRAQGRRECCGAACMEAACMEVQGQAVTCVGLLHGRPPVGEQLAWK